MFLHPENAFLLDNKYNQWFRELINQIINEYVWWIWLMIIMYSVRYKREDIM